MPANLTAACPELPALEKPTMAEAVKNHVETTRLYHECASKHRELATLCGAP